MHTDTDSFSAATNIHYNDGSPASIESVMNFGTTSTVDILTTLDGLGRQELTQRDQQQSGSTYDSVETEYDALGRPWKISPPYSAGRGVTYTGSTFASTATYDGLNRPLTVTYSTDTSPDVSYSYSANDVLVTVSAPSGEKQKKRQLEYDALGRLTSVCEITAALPGRGICGQSNPLTGYWTTYTYDALGDLAGVTQNAQPGSSMQTRNYKYDELGRLILETNPENGTVNYYWDQCKDYPYTEPGDVCEKTDNAGNETTYGYDALHRLGGVRRYNRAS